MKGLIFMIKTRNVIGAIIAGLIMAVIVMLVVTSFANASSDNSAQADEVLIPRELSLNTGKFYLDGDKESGIYIEVTPDTIQLVSEDRKLFAEKCGEAVFIGSEKKDYDICTENFFKDYGDKKAYKLVDIPELETANIFIDWQGDDESGYAGYGYGYEDENTILLAENLRFVLVS